MTQIPYGDPDTVYGVITERLPDGGVTITVPQAGGPIGWLARFVNKALRDFPHRAVFTLNREHLKIVQPGNSETSNKPIELTFALSAVGEIRPNRYYKGVYVSIPGLYNADLLTEVNQKIVNYVGDTLCQTLAKIRSTSA